MPFSPSLLATQKDLDGWRLTKKTVTYGDRILLFLSGGSRGLYSKSQISSGSTNRDKIKSPQLRRFPFNNAEAEFLSAGQTATCASVGRGERSGWQRGLRRAYISHGRSLTSMYDQKAILNPFQSGPMAERLTEKAHIKKKVKKKGLIGRLGPGMFFSEWISLGVMEKKSLWKRNEWRG